jgi:exopolyphosphatase / guanosine-5'-triphosphate,3'-diphosphate pyrophosphatase
MAATTDNGARERPEALAPAPQKKPEPLDAYAALDLGTNSCRMLVAHPRGSQFHVIDSFSKPVHLGRGLEREGCLSQSSIRRTIEALKTCRKKLDHHKVTRMRLVATEACRRATNGDQFIHRVEQETGLKLKIIAAEEEAQLAVVSCAPLVSQFTEQLLVVDIGGGSTELVWINLAKVPPLERARAIMRLRDGFHGGPSSTGFPRAVVEDWISVPAGVATLKDQFDDVEEDSARFALMSCHFEELIAGFAPYRDGGQPEPRKDFQIIGTSGTVTTVAASHLGLRRYDRSKVDGLRMTTGQIDAVIRHYLDLGPAGRQRDPRIGRDRQALILSGVAILQTLMRVWPTDRMSVADRGLREGLLYSQMSADGVLKDGPG